MFGGWPHEMAGFPIDYYRDLVAYYFKVKDSEHQAVNDTEPDS